MKRKLYRKQNVKQIFLVRAYNVECADMSGSAMNHSC